MVDRRRDHNATLAMALALLLAAILGSWGLSVANAHRGSGAATFPPTTTSAIVTTTVATPTTLPPTTTTQVPGALSPAQIEAMLATVRSRVAGRIQRSVSGNGQVACQGGGYPNAVVAGSQITCTVTTDTGGTTVVAVLVRSGGAFVLNLVSSDRR